MAVRISKHMFWPLFSDDQWGDSEHGGRREAVAVRGWDSRQGLSP